MLRRAVPSWVVTALQSANLMELHQETGISRRQLIRIKKGETRWIRDDTLRKLRHKLRPPLQSLPLDPREVELIYQMARREDLQELYDLLQDPLRTGLEIHKLMVDRGWDISDLTEAYRKSAEAPKVVKVKGEVRLHLRDELPLSDRLDLLVERGLEREKQELVGLTSRGLQERLQRIISGERITLAELCLIAQVLDVTPGELLIADQRGLDLFQEALRESSRRGDTKTNELLNSLRVFLDLSF